MPFSNKGKDVTKKRETISRRQFLVSGAAVGAGLFGLSLLGRDGKPRALKQPKPNRLAKRLAVVHGENPREMTRRAIAELGGMDKLVSAGDVVVIKPNMAWDRPPELGANTNPDVVSALIEMCLEAGSAKVKVFDNTPSPNPRSSYEASGIAAAARRAGADVHFIRPGGFPVLPIPDGEALQEWAFYEEAVLADEVDVLINVPVAKHHSTSRLTMGLKFLRTSVDHGTAFDIAGKGIANPSAMFLSAAMMFEYAFRLNIEAKLIHEAVSSSLDKNFTTEDISDNNPRKTSEVGEWIVNYILKRNI